MNYSDFLDIARYANECWKGGYSEQELKDLAREYWNDYKTALVNGYIENGSVLDSLIERLVEDYESDYLDEDTSWQLSDWLEDIAVTTGFRDFFELMNAYSDNLYM